MTAYYSPSIYYELADESEDAYAPYTETVDNIDDVRGASSYTLYQNDNDEAEDPETASAEDERAEVARSALGEFAESQWAWNARYQAALDAHDHAQIAALTEAFFLTASTYGKMIVSERHLPPEAKQIKPQALGGLAGGDKFIVHGILFKYAQDVSLNKEGTRWLYGGSTRRDDLALKSTNHELTGLAHILDAYERATHKRGAKTETSRPVLRHALVALLDCQGVRLTAIALLPISKETLVYGSANGGEHVAARTDAHAVMLEVASELNLAPHRVADKELALCGDLEVHATGESLYVLDTARVFPPAAPTPEERATGAHTIFYALLRPELVRGAATPLSSDAFSAWQTHDPRHTQLNRAVTVVTRDVLNTRLPAYALELSEDVARVNARLMHDSVLATQLSAHDDARLRYQEPLVREMHARGLNLRWLGALRHALRLQGRNATLVQHMLHVMVTRALKNLWRAHTAYRSNSATAHVSAQEYARDATVQLLRRLVQRDETLWHDELVHTLRAMFGNKALSEDEERSLAARLDLRFIVVRFCQLCGIVLAPPMYAALSAASTPSVTALDVVELRALIKSLPQHNVHIGLHYRALARAQLSRHARVRYLTAACDALARAHHAHPTQPAWSRLYASTLVMLFRLEPMRRVQLTDLALAETLLAREVPQQRAVEEVHEAEEVHLALVLAAVWRLRDEDVTLHGADALLAALPASVRGVMTTLSDATLRSLCDDMRAWTARAARCARTHVTTTLLSLLAPSPLVTWTRAELTRSEAERAQLLRTLWETAPDEYARLCAALLERIEDPCTQDDEDSETRASTLAVLRVVLALATQQDQSMHDCVTAALVTRVARAQCLLSAPPRDVWQQRERIADWHEYVVEDAHSWWAYLHAWLRVARLSALHEWLRDALSRLHSASQRAHVLEGATRAALALEALVHFSALCSEAQADARVCATLTALMEAWLRGLLSYEDEAVAHWSESYVRALVELLQYALFAFPALCAPVLELLVPALVTHRPLHARALVRVLLAVWGLAEFEREPLARLQNTLRRSTAQRGYDVLPLPIEDAQALLTAPRISLRRQTLLGLDAAPEAAASASMDVSMLACASPALACETLRVLVLTRRVALVEAFIHTHVDADVLALLLAPSAALWSDLAALAHAPSLTRLVHALCERANALQPSAAPPDAVAQDAAVPASLLARLAETLLLAGDGAFVAAVLEHPHAAQVLDEPLLVPRVLATLLAADAAAALAAVLVRDSYRSHVCTAAWLSAHVARVASIASLCALLAVVPAAQVAEVVVPHVLTQRWFGALRVLVFRGFVHALTPLTLPLLGETRTAPLLCHALIADPPASTLAPSSLCAVLLASYDTPGALSAALEVGVAPHRMPLLVAAQSGRLGALRALLALGVRVDVRDHVGRTALHFAAMQSDPQLVHTLLDHGAHVDDVDKTGVTPVYVSIDCGQVEAFSALLERGASLTPPKSRLPALHCAASLGHVALVQRLVAHGLSVNAQDALGDTPLHCAALAQQVRVVRALLALGANRSIRNAKQLRACDVARTPLLQALLSEDGVPASPPADKCEPGALAQRLDDGKCPAHTLSAEGEVYVLQRLLSCTPHARELVHVRDKHGRTPLHLASTAAVVRTLLDAGADIHARDAAGSTPLSQCLLANHTDAVKELLARGAEVEASALFQATLQKAHSLLPLLAARVPVHEVRDGQAQTPLHLAAFTGDLATAQLLLDAVPPEERAAFLAATDKQQQTALHKAARRGYEAMCEWLCAQGADGAALDARGQSARDLAQQAGFSGVVRVLEQAQRVAASSVV